MRVPRLCAVMCSAAALALSSVVLPGTSTAAVAPRDAPPTAGMSQEISKDVILGTFVLLPNDTGGIGGLPGELLHNNYTFGIQPPCQDCQITSAVPDLTDTNGNSVNMDTGPMLHHFVVAKEGAPDVSCPVTGIPSVLGERLFASGNERTPMSLPPGYGLYVAPGEQWLMISDLMNYSSQFQTVQVRMHVTYVPGHALKDVTPVWLDETTPCLPSYYDILPGQSHQSTTWISDISGTVVEMAGHLHENGTHIVATDQNTGQQLCDSNESQMPMPMGPAAGVVMVTGMSTCVGNPPGYLGHIKWGDPIRMDAYYDTDHVQQGVMGIMIMYVAQD